MKTTTQTITLKNGYKIWTQSTVEGTTPILLLHGGPGSTHEYLECFSRLLPQHAYQVIVYDQLGSYNSDKPNDPSLWTVERFTEEIEEIRQALNINKFFLFGFSWGGILGIEYALKYQNNLLGLIISNMTASVADYENRMANLRYKMPQNIQQMLTSFETANDFSNPEYKELLYEWLVKKHICRLDPFPAPLMQAFSHTNRDIYNYMWGKNDFCVEGTLRTWCRWDDLSTITIPTLLLGGEHDIVDPQDLNCMAQEIRGAQVFISKKSSHFPFYEDQDAYFKALIQFLKKN